MDYTDKIDIKQMDNKPPTPLTFQVEAKSHGERLDKFLTSKLPELSRSRVQALIAQGFARLQGEAVTDASYHVKSAQEWILIIPETQVSHLLAQEMPLDILYEDDDLLVLNKPAGLTVHPAPGHPDHTLVNALLAHCGASLSGIGGVARPGIVHRIDKDTSGLLVVAKHDRAHAHLSAQLSDHSLQRTYLALVWGQPKAASGTITGNIGRSPSNRQKMAVVKSGGKPATTHYEVLKRFHCSLNAPFISLIQCKLETGRTHQIRVHMGHIGHPLVGDPVYGQTTRSRLAANVSKALSPETREKLLSFERQALHAKELILVHPVTDKSMQFACALPQDMEKLLEVLSIENNQS